MYDRNMESELMPQKLKLENNQQNQSQVVEQQIHGSEDSNGNDSSCRVQNPPPSPSHSQELSQLEIEKLEQLNRENQKYRVDNEKLQYLLTALESENESIGEYVALYRFQRGNIQRRIADKDKAFAELQQQCSALMTQLVELHNSVVDFLNGCNYCKKILLSKTEGEEAKQLEHETIHHLQNELVGQEVLEEKGSESECDRERHPQQQEATAGHRDETQKQSDTGIDRLLVALKRSRLLSNRAACSAVKEAQTHCTGCVECRGEMFTL